MGVANERSIAWGIAQALHGAGAELAFTYQGGALRQARVLPMVEKLGAKIVEEADVENDASLDGCSPACKKDWGQLDFVVHAIAFSDKEELKGRYVDTTTANFPASARPSPAIPSPTIARQRAAADEPEGGSLITLTYDGATRVMPSLQRHGRRQGGARGQRPLSRRPTSAAGRARQRASRPGRCGRSRAR